MIQEADEIPDVPSTACFKYSRPWGEGDLTACVSRLMAGEDLRVAAVSASPAPNPTQNVRGADGDCEVQKEECL